MFSTPVCFRVPTPKRGRVFIISTDSLASWRLPPCFFLLFCSAQAPCALVVVFFQFTARTIILPLVQCQSNSVKSSSPDPKKLSGVCTKWCRNPGHEPHRSSKRAVRTIPILRKIDSTQIICKQRARFGSSS